MKKLLYLLLLVPALANATRGDIVFSTFISSQTSSQLEAEIVAATNILPGLMGIQYNINTYIIGYETVDYDGTPITATGLLAMPSNFPCATPICVYGHGWVMKHDEVPSVVSNRWGYFTRAVAANGFICIAPDYIHLGAQATPGFQGYMHAQSEADAYVDMIRATKSFADQQGAPYTDQLFLFGYSQGGHATMAATKDIQENYPTEFDITASMPGGGYYDLSGIGFDTLTSLVWLQHRPHIFCLTMRSYYEAYYDSLSNYGAVIPFEDYWQPPYDTLIRDLLDPANPFDSTELLSAIPALMLTDSFRTLLLTNPNYWMHKFLTYNDLYNWTPTVNMQVYHAAQDEEVPYENAQFTVDTMLALGATTVSLSTLSGNFTHEIGGLFHTLSARQLFISLRTSCTGVDDINRFAAVKVFPAPFDDHLTADFSAVEHGDLNWQLLDIQGRILTEGQLGAGSQTLTVARPNGLTTGLYFLRLQEGTNQFSIATLAR